MTTEAQIRERAKEIVAISTGWPRTCILEGRV